MSVNDTTATTAQDNQIPPALRNWARLRCHGVRRIERFDSEHEKHGRGWKVEGRTLRPRHLPDGYRVGNVTGTTDNGIVRMQVREE